MAVKFSQEVFDAICDRIADGESLRSILQAEVLEIADTTDDPQKARLQVDARKWIASKLLPKVYGDKVSHEHGGPDGGAIPHSVKVEFGRGD